MSNNNDDTGESNPNAKPPRKKREATGDYDNGYCRPPVATRFPAGTSGNPSGRRKGSVGLIEALKKELGRKIRMTLPDGTVKHLAAVEICAARLVKGVATGEPKAMAALLSLAAKFPEILDLGGSTAERDNGDDQTAAEELLRMLRADIDHE